VSAGKAVVYRDAQGLWRWRLVAANGDITATSGEGYTHRQHALEMATRMSADVEIDDPDAVRD
jgi:uncharacterized protein